MRFSKLITTALFGLLICPLGKAQSCSKLSTAWDAKAGALSVKVSGAPAKTFTALVIGTKLGKTTRGNLTLGIAMPFFPVFLGLTDANGAISRSLSGRSAPKKITLYFQAVSIKGMDRTRRGRGQRGGSGSYCVSNTSSVTFP